VVGCFQRRRRPAQCRGRVARGWRSVRRKRPVAGGIRLEHV